MFLDIKKQLAAMHPEMVSRLILIAAPCGGKEAIPPSPQVVNFFSEMVNKSINNIPITPQHVRILLSNGKMIKSLNGNAVIAFVFACLLEHRQ